MECLIKVHNRYISKQKPSAKMKEMGFNHIMTSKRTNAKIFNSKKIAKDYIDHRNRYYYGIRNYELINTV